MPTRNTYNATAVGSSPQALTEAGHSMASMDETQTKPNRRRIDSDSGDVQYGNAGPEAFSGAERLDTLQTHVGNELVLDAFRAG